MNVITITGQLGKDAEQRFIPSGESVVIFSVADNQNSKEKPAIWWRCNLWGKRGEALLQYLTKGQAVTVVGAITESEYNDKDTGAKRKAFDVRVMEIALQGGKRDQTEPRQEARAPAAASVQAAAITAKTAGGSGFDDMPDDIPF